MVKSTFLILLLVTQASWGQALREDDLGNQSLGSSGGQLSQEQIQQMMQTSGADRSAASHDPLQLQKLLEKVKDLQGTVDERNKMLDQLMKEQ